MAARAVAAAVLLLLMTTQKAALALNDGLARTPPMGFNTWFWDNGGPGDDARLRQVADAMASNGMLAAGYNTITIDDLWSNGRDPATNDWIPLPDRFPNGLPPLISYIQSKGFLVGG
jgi:alpha-galactosidase